MKRVEAKKRLLAFFGAVCLMVTGSFMTVTAAEVTPSVEEYSVSFKNHNIFIGNAKAVNAKAGDEVYLTYTVKKVRDDNEAMQHGVVGTNQPELEFPYTDGGVLYGSNTAPLLQEGNTYFFKFTQTENGMEYIVAVSDEKASKYIVFDYNTQDFTDDCTHFGVWFGGSGIASAILSNVRCYDQDGNDLGVYAPRHRESLMDSVTKMDKDTEVNHTYSIVLEDGRNVAMSNEIPTKADTVYMEYTVKKSDSKLNQTGVLNHNAPTVWYPHAENGCLLVEAVTEPGPGYLLQEGASYIVRFERREQFYMTIIQKTYKGKSELHEFVSSYGPYIYGAPYFGLWFGEGESKVSFELENFKCYDSDKNNLGVQFNSPSGPVEVIHYGELLDYSGCEAMYYSKDTESIIALYGDKTAKVTRDGKTQEITYVIEEDVLTLQFKNKEEVYKYFYQKFTDEQGRLYVRLGTYYVDFITGTETNIERQTINAAGGYKATQPNELQKEGAEFLGWYLSDGTEFDFNSIIDESITLYAKWSDELTYTEVGKNGNVSAPIIAITISAILLIIGISGGVLVVKRGKKNEQKKKETN